jgi:hypothetical protein
MATPPRFRTGTMFVLLPSGTPEHTVRRLLRQEVVEALAATGEWPTSTRIVSGTRHGDGQMKRWLVEYETGPHGEVDDEPYLFD